MTLVVDNGSPATTVAPRRSYRRRRYRRSRYSRYSRRRPRYSRFRRRRRRTIQSPLNNKFLLAQIDPFNEDCRGAKIPDCNTYPSTAFRVDDVWTALSTDANGIVARAFQPTIVNQIIDHVAATSSTWTWQANYAGGHDSSRLSNIIANFSLFRPVAHGVRITCPGVPTSVTGQLHVAIVTDDCRSQTSWNLPQSISEMSNCMFYQRFPLNQFTQQGVTIVNKFLDCTATRYMNPNSDGVANSSDINFQTNGWGVIMVVVEGGGNAQLVLEVENVLHVEAIALKSGLSTSTPAAPYNVGVLQNVSRMAGQTPAAFSDTGRNEYFQDVANSVRTGIRRSEIFALNNIITPAAERMGYGLGAYAISAGLAGAVGLANRFIPSGFQSPNAISPVL